LRAPALPDGEGPAHRREHERHAGRARRRSRSFRERVAARGLPAAPEQGYPDGGIARSPGAHMGKAKKKKLRACPAAGREITAQECGEGRHARYACPPGCGFDPFTEENYAQVLE